MVEQRERNNKIYELKMLKRFKLNEYKAMFSLSNRI